LANLRVNKAMVRHVRGLQKGLKLRRLEYGLALPELASLVEVSQRTVLDWERAYEQPAMLTAMRWAAVLDMRFIIRSARSDHDFTPLSQPGQQLPAPEQDWLRLCAPLKQLRVDRGLSQTELGLVTGVSRSSIQRCEDGTQYPRLLLLTAMANQFGCVLDLREQSL